MQINVLSAEGLERHIRVVFKDEEINKIYQDVVNYFVKDEAFKVSGFRAGKVPKDLIVKYRRREIDEETYRRLQSSAIRGYQKQIHEMINFVFNVSYDANEKALDLALVLARTELPEIDLKEIKVDMPVVDLDEATSEMVLALRQQKATEVLVEEPVNTSSVVDLSIKTSDNLGQPFEALTFETLKYHVGTPVLPFDISNSLVGKKAGDEYTQEYEVSADVKYKCEIKVNAVYRNELPEVNEDFVKQFLQRNGTVEELKQEIEKNVKREIGINTVRIIYPQLVAGLKEAYNNLEVGPNETLKEYSSIFDSYRKRLVELQYSEEDIAKYLDDAETKEKMKQDAENDYKANLAISYIVNKYEIRPTQEMVEDFIDEMSIMFEYPEGYKLSVMKDEKMLNVYRLEVFHKLFVETLLPLVSVTEERISYRSLVNRGLVSFQ